LKDNEEGIKKTMKKKTSKAIFVKQIYFFSANHEKLLKRLLCSKSTKRIWARVRIGEKSV